jgi:hypothetical protein
MKKLALALAAFGALAFVSVSGTPAVYACPGHDGEKSDTDAPKTAKKDEKQKKAPAKKKDEKKNEKKETEKKDGDKVSMK